MNKIYAKVDESDELVSGMIERITFYSEESGFAVLKVKMSQKKDLISVIGTIPSITIGEYIHASGVWINDKNYGLQFKANFIRATRPNTLDGMEKYLASGVIKGIGPHLANKLVSKFGIEVFEVIENSPDLLSSVEGIGKTRASFIIQNWAEQSAVREIMLFLQSHGISTAKATRIYKTYKENAIRIVSENPYILAKDISGIGFLSADKIAMNLGIGEQSIVRARAAINYTLTIALSEGHSGLFREDLLEKAEKLVSIPYDILTEALTAEIQEGSLKENILKREIVISLTAYAIYENHVASRLKVLNSMQPIWHVIDSYKAIEWVEKKLSIELGDNQKEAIRTALQNKITVIIGGPGTGKTTLLNALMKILKAAQYKILLSAPTGRAAKRLSESTGMAAMTIHRLLKFDQSIGRFKHSVDSPLDCDVLVIDEFSMVDIQLMYFVMRALPQGACLILVGDVDQLPSVGPGQVLSDIIDSNIFSVVRLTQIFRQAASSRIISNAHRINTGSMPILEPVEKSDFFYVSADAPEEILKKVVHLVSSSIVRKFNYNSVRDIQVLTPMQRGSCGVTSLNIELQKTLNPKNIAGGIERFGQRYCVSDKVIQTTNNYDKEVYNGDVGFITGIDHENKELSINFDGRNIVYDFSEIDEISLAYAITIHKSQGSEYPVVVMPITMQHYVMLKKNLLYTGVTRGKCLVILVGQKKAIYMSVKSDNQIQRISRLKEILIDVGSVR